MEITKEKFGEIINQSWIAVSSATFILYGIIYSSIYYYSFRVPIFSYITFTELISFFISDVVYFIVLALFIAPFIYTNQMRVKVTLLKDRLNSSYVKLADMKMKLENLKEVKDAETKNRLLYEIDSFNSQMETVNLEIITLDERLIRMIKIPFIVFGVFLLFIIAPLLIIDFLEFSPLAFIAVVFFVVYMKLKNIYIPFIFVVLVGSTFGAISEAYFVKHGKTIGYQISLEASPSPLISDSINFYIGKTEKFIFIYKTKDEVTEVYPSEEIKKISIPIEDRGMLYFLTRKFFN